MNMQEHNWVDSVPFAITVCDKEGVIIEMNEKSALTFAKDGGKQLIGKSLYGCHSPKDNRTIADMMAGAVTNVYTIEREGKKKMIYQCPWYQNGELGGLVEISFALPDEVPHFNRTVKIIYHITHPALWQKAQSDGQYIPEAFGADGFIHCSKKEQIPCVGNLYYKGQTGLIILSINLEKIKPAVKWENTTGGDELFPHIYGALNTDAVEFTAAFKPNEAGEFEFPETWEKVSK